MIELININITYIYINKELKLITMVLCIDIKMKIE